MVGTGTSIAASLIVRLLSFALGGFVGMAALRMYNALPDGSLLVAGRLLLLFGMPQAIAAYVALCVSRWGGLLAIFSGVAAAAVAAFLVTWLSAAVQAPAGTGDGCGMPALGIALMFIFLPILNGGMAFLSSSLTINLRAARSL
jgi:hypothetical protein